MVTAITDNGKFWPASVSGCLIEIWLSGASFNEVSAYVSCLQARRIHGGQFDGCAFAQADLDGSFEDFLSVVCFEQPPGGFLQRCKMRHGF